jgi:hypothetical protein
MEHVPWNTKIYPTLADWSKACREHADPINVRKLWIRRANLIKRKNEHPNIPMEIKKCERYISRLSEQSRVHSNTIFHYGLSENDIRLGKKLPLHASGLSSRALLAQNSKERAIKELELKRQKLVQLQKEWTEQLPIIDMDIQNAKEWNSGIKYR